GVAENRSARPLSRNVSAVNGTIPLTANPLTRSKIELSYGSRPGAVAERTCTVVCHGSLAGWRNSSSLRAARSISVDSAASSVISHRFVSRLRSEEHTSELQSLRHLVCRLLLE